MGDDLGLFADHAGERSALEQPRGSRGRRAVPPHRRRRSTLTALGGLCVLLLVAGVVGYAGLRVFGVGFHEDYEGAGTGNVVVEVKSGSSVSAIAKTLERQDVVASAGAFKAAAENNDEMSGVQPGFYLMRSKMSAQAAVDHMLSPAAKTGRVEIRGGMRLEDQLAPDGSKTPGILTRLAQASCSGGQQKCVTSEDLHTTAAAENLAELGVPAWAVGPASAAEPKRRLEGLIMPGIYDIKPGSDARELLRSVLGDSAARLEAAGLPQVAEGTGFSPYEVLTVASLAQSEGTAPDFGKVTRVIYNRHKIRMPLQFDSTINYPLDKPALLTKSEDRARLGPYNTYKNVGLPPTPISTASKEAIIAAEKPNEGNWIYFVKCYKDGTSCFSENPQQHEAAKQQAQQRGAY